MRASRRPCALRPRSPPRVRWRAIGTCPFLRCAFRAPYGEQSDELSLNCAGDFLVVHFVDLSHMGNTHRTRQWNAMRKCYSLPPIEPSWNALCKCNNSPHPCQGSVERAGGAATRGGGGDGGRRGRRQARCRRSGDGRYSDRAGRRQTAPHADAAPRRNPPEPEMCRSEAEGRFGVAEPEGCASIHVRRPYGHP